jgi:histidinol-phosphate aminotransferase
MSLPFLRSDLPGAYPFRVTQKPHKAKLDQNESPVDIPAELKRDIVEELVARPWNRYVQPAEYAEAKRCLGEALGFDPDSIAITVGGDQAIEAAFSIAGGPRRSARWFEPTYPYISHAAGRTFTREQPIPLGLGVDELTVDQVLADPAPNLIAFVVPNNPTGGVVDAAVIDAALDDDKRLVLVDEAYYDFSGITFADRLASRPNLMIARSLSKASLAAGHVGYVLAHPDVVAHVERMYTAPYHVNAMQVALARRFGDIAPHIRSAAAAVIAERTRVTEALRALSGITARDSHANFVLFHVGERAAEVHSLLADAGVRIRTLDHVPGLAGYLRVTIGTSLENDLFLAELARAIGVD